MGFPDMSGSEKKIVRKSHFRHISGAGLGGIG